MKRAIICAGIITLFCAILAQPVFAALTLSDTAILGNGSLGLSGGADSIWDVNGILSLNTTNNGAITTGTGLLTAAGGITISPGKNLIISSGTGSLTTTLSPGGNTASFSLNSTVGGIIGYNDNFKSINNSLVFDPTGVNAAFSNVYGTYNYINVPASNSVNFPVNSLLLIPSYNYIKDESSGNTGEYLVGSWNKAEQAGSGVMHRTYGSWNEALMTNGSGQYLAGSISQAKLENGTTTSVVGAEITAMLGAWPGNTASTGNVYGVRSNTGVVAFNGTASATNVYDFYAQNSAPNAVGYPLSIFSYGTIQNYYGLYIEEHTHGVNNWNLYSAGGQNYFGGNVGIGTPTPGKLLSVGSNLWQADSNGVTWANGSQTTYTGSTSGTAVWSMPEQGSAYKKLVIYFNALNDAGGTISYPTAFTHTPYIYGAAACTAIMSSDTSTLTLAPTLGVTGYCFVEGD